MVKYYSQISQQGTIKCPILIILFSFSENYLPFEHKMDNERLTWQEDFQKLNLNSASIGIPQEVSLDLIYYIFPDSNFLKLFTARSRLST